MAGYNEIRGLRVKYLSADPSNAENGQVWYNSTSGNLRVQGIGIEATSSTSPMTTGRVQGGGGGIQTDGFGAGGYTTTNVAITEEYNGSGFSAGGNLTSARRAMGGTGQTPAGLVFGGYTTTRVGLTEEYNGSSWSESGDLSTTRYAISSANGSPQTAALGFAGYATAASNATEEYNGTSWTAGGTLNVATFDAAGAGTQTSALMCGGSKPGVASNITELYDGSSWTTSGTLNLGRQLNMAFGTQTAAVTLGGIKTFSPDVTTNTIETFNGSTWSTSPATLATSRSQAFGIGAPTAGIVFGGSAPGPKLSVAEEYNFSTNTVTAAAWSSGGNLNTAREQGGVAGTTPAGIYMTGKVYPNTFKNETEEYNGTSWSEQNNVSTARTASGAGTQTAGLIFGGTNGAPGSTGVQSATEEYDGSSWTNGGSLSAARLGMYGAGLQTAAFGAGGIISTNAAVTTVEDYNGSAWTSGTAIPSAQQGGGSAGLPSARLIFGGYSPYSAVTLEGDGEGWTAGGNMNQARGILAGFGSQTDAIAAGGSVNPNANSALAEGYDGTSWSTRPSLATARMSFSPSGAYNTTTGGFVAGGSQQGNPQNAQTEEWNAETVTAAPAKTLTTS